MKTHHQIVEWCMANLLPGLTLNPDDFSLQSYNVQEVERRERSQMKIIGIQQEGFMFSTVACLETLQVPQPTSSCLLPCLGPLCLIP